MRGRKSELATDRNALDGVMSPTDWLSLTNCWVDSLGSLVFGSQLLHQPGQSFDALLDLIEFEPDEQVLPLHYREHGLEDLTTMPSQDQQMLAARTELA